MPSLIIENNVQVLDETVIPIGEIGQCLPFDIAPAAVQRWLRSGVAGFRLESAVVGKRRFTSKEAVRRFLAKINGNDPEAVQETPVKPFMSSKERIEKRDRFKLPKPGRNGVASEQGGNDHEN